MKEDKYLNDLFEQAKNEPPQLSFEEVANRFETTLPTTDPISVLKEWFFNHLNLNSFFMITIASIVLSSLYLVFAPTTTVELVENTPEIIRLEKITQPTEEMVSESTLTVNEPEITIEQPTNVISPTKVNEVENLDNLTVEKVETPENTTTFIEIPETVLSNKLPTIPILKNDKKRAIELPANRLLPANTIRESIYKTALGKGSGSKDNQSPQEDYNYSQNQSNPQDGYGTTIDTDEKRWNELTKTFQQTFPLTPNGLTKIVNEFGKVNIKTWDEPKVKIDVLVTVSAHKSGKAEKVLKNIQVDFSKTPDKVEAITNVSNRKAIRWNNRKNWKVSIDYEVYVPKNSSLNLYHYNGEVTIGELLGKADLELRFVNFEAESIGDNSRIILSNGKGRLENGGNLSSKLHFAELRTGKLGAVELNVKNSTFQTKEAQNVSGTSTYGKLKLGTIKDFEISGTGGSIDIQKAKKVNMRHGNAEIFIDYAGDVTANLSFCQFRSTEIGNVELNIKNSKFRAEKAKNIVGNSLWGDIDFGSIENYENNSNGTKVKIDAANSVKSKGQNTKMSIGTLKNALSLDFLFGTYKIKMSNPAPEVNLQGKNADFHLTIPQQAQYNFELNSNTQNYTFPISFQLKRHISTAAKHELEGFVGQPNNNNTLKAQLLWGKLEIKN